MNKKIAEFNYKLLLGVLPCGKSLTKWNRMIAACCSTCNKEEDLEHMLYSCQNCSWVWKAVEVRFNVSIKWKHLVVGFLPDTNQTVRILNFITPLLSYSIFKANNMCKWHQVLYTKQHVKDMILYDCIRLKDMHMYLEAPEISIECVKQLIEMFDK